MKPWLAPVVIVVVGLLAWSSSLDGAFVFDDHRQIVERAEDLAAPLPALLSGDRRPLVTLTLAANHAVSGLEPWSYHVFNVAIHVAAALVLLGLVRRSVRLVAPGTTPRGADAFALAVAMLWMLHPLQTESVTYVIQRAEAMAGLATLLTLYALLRGATTAGRGVGWYVLAIVACAAGMASKAVAVTTPLLAVAFDALVITGSLRATLRARWGVHAGLAATWLVLAVTGAITGVLDPTPPERAGAGLGVTEVGVLEYLATQPGVVVHYLWLSIWPRVLCIDYRWPVVATFVGVAGPVLVLLTLGAVNVVAARRRRWTAVLGVAFVLLLAPTSSLIPVRDLAFEHRMYLALAPVIVGLVGITWWMLGRFEGRTARRVAVPLLVLVAGALATRTIVRNRDYAQPVRLWAGGVEVNPDNWRARMNLALALRDAGRMDDAEAELAATAEAWPGRALVRFNYGMLLAETGRLAEATPHLRSAAAAMEDRLDAQLQLAEVLRSTQCADEAAERFAHAATLAPRDARIRIALGNTLAEAGRSEEAAAVFEQGAVVAARAGDHDLRVSCLFNAGNTWYRLEAWRDAIRCYEQVIAVDPDHKALRWLDLAREKADRSTDR